MLLTGTNSGIIGLVIPRRQHSAQTSSSITVPRRLRPLMITVPLTVVRLVRQPHRLHCSAPSGLTMRLTRWRTASAGSGVDGWTSFSGTQPFYKPARLNARASDSRNCSNVLKAPFCEYMASIGSLPSRISLARVGPNTSICRAALCFFSQSP